MNNIDREKCYESNFGYSKKKFSKVHEYIRVVNQLKRSLFIKHEQTLFTSILKKKNFCKLLLCFAVYEEHGLEVRASTIHKGYTRPTQTMRKKNISFPICESNSHKTDEDIFFLIYEQD